MTPISAVTVAVAIGTFTSRRSKTAHSHCAADQLSTSVCPVAFTSSDTGATLCSTGLVCQIPAPKVGVDREVEPKSCCHSSRQSGRFGRVRRCARSSLVGQRQSCSASPAAPVLQRPSCSASPAASVLQRPSGSARRAAPVRQRPPGRASPAASVRQLRSETAPT